MMTGEGCASIIMIILPSNKRRLVVRPIVPRYPIVPAKLAVKLCSVLREGEPQPLWEALLKPNNISTVSKVLRNKEKYLVPEDGSRSPVKRSKSKFPDLERTLMNWVKNRVSDGLAVTDDAIKDEARKYAATLGNSEGHVVVSDPVWLEKFKQKNNLPGAKSKDSKGGDKDGLSPPSKSGSQTPNGISPTVSWDAMAVHPVKDEFTKSPDSYYDSSASAWSHNHSQSTASMGSVYSDITIASSFTDFRSPTSPFFSPTSSSGPSPAMPAQKPARLPPLAPASYLRRRQTVPLVGSESSPDSASSKNPFSSTLESPAEEMEMSPLIGEPVSRATTTIPTAASLLAHSQLMGPPPPMSASVSANVSPTTPPSKDEARVALQVLLDYIHRCPEGMIDPHDYIVMGKLMQVLRLDGNDLPGGMHSIALNERIAMAERADGTVPIGRKRSEHSLS